jgi:hypothetical protein
MRGASAPLVEIEGHPPDPLPEEGGDEIRGLCPSGWLNLQLLGHGHGMAQ